MQIYVGNLSYKLDETELRTVFERFGQVTRVNLVTDRESGRPRGFGFVEMPTQVEAKAAITALDGKEMNGRELTVNEARPRTIEAKGNRPPSGQSKPFRNYNSW